MAIQDWQIQDLINKTNIIYNVTSNTLNAPISSVLANVINGTNQLQNRLTQSQQQATSLTQYNIDVIGRYINGLGDRTYRDITTSTNKVSNDLQLKMNAVSQDIQKKVDSVNQDIHMKLDSVNGEVKQVVTNILQPLMSKADADVAKITANVNNSIINLETDLKSANIQTQNIVVSAKNTITDAIQAASKVTATQNKGTTPVTPASTSSFSINEPAWLTAIMENFYNQGKTKPHTETDILSKFLLSTFVGANNFDLQSGIINGNPFDGLLEFANKLGGIELNLVNGKYKTLDDFNKDFKTLGIDSSIIGVIFQILIVAFNVTDYIKDLGLPTHTKLQQLMVASYSLKQLNENDLLLAYIRNNMPPSDVKKNLDNLGHSQEDSDLIMKNALPKYSIQELFRLAHLGKIDGKTLIERMRELGWNEIDAIKHGYLSEVRPPVNDLIQFAVKEVYSPEITSLFGQFQDFPKTFSTEAQLLGMSEDNAKKYWAAHWQLPSAGMGYDMFHRRIINLDQLRALLKALDVMPFWRDKLVNLAYNVVARVDTRRLYAYGIWTKEKVYQNYLDEGYKPEDAQALTQFTIAYDKDHEDKHTSALKKKTHDVYIKSYLAGLINKEQAIQHILGLGYKREDIELELNLEDYEDYVNSHKPKNENHTAKLISLSSDGYRKKSLSRGDYLGILINAGYSLSEANTEADFIDKESEIIWKETLIKEIQKLYFESLIDDNGVLTKLMALGFTNSEALHIIGQLQTLKSLDDKKPTQAQFKAMFEGNIISQSDYERELADMGYSQKYIPALVALSTGK